jgi:hypothetical protein
LLPNQPKTTAETLPKSMFFLVIIFSSEKHWNRNGKALGKAGRFWLIIRTRMGDARMH